MASVKRVLQVALVFLACNAMAGPSRMGVEDLDATYCEGEYSSQEFWYRREPPFVGYGRGEALAAGGSGSCVVGFAKGAHIAVNGQAVSLVAHRDGETLVSSDGQIRVHITETGRDSSCVLGEDKCCGEYTYATATIYVGTRKEIIQVVRYEGG